jgi:hypothetical protein
MIKDGCAAVFPVGLMTCIDESRGLFQSELFEKSV